MSEPALSEYQWSTFLDDGSDRITVAFDEASDFYSASRVELSQDDTFFNIVTDDYEGHAMFVHALRLPVAAAALWGQPFGFTWDDVDTLRSITFADERLGDELRLAAVADTIERLLPPRDLPGAVEAKKREREVKKAEANERRRDKRRTAKKV